MSSTCTVFDSLPSAVWWCYEGELGWTLLWLSPVLWLAAIITARSLLLVLTVELFKCLFGSTIVFEVSHPFASFRSRKKLMSRLET